jgi:hypothetical protein
MALNGFDQGWQRQSSLREFLFSTICDDSVQGKRACSTQDQRDVGQKEGQRILGAIPQEIPLPSVNQKYSYQHIKREQRCRQPRYYAQQQSCASEKLHQGKHNGRHAWDGHPDLPKKSADCAEPPHKQLLPAMHQKNDAQSDANEQDAPGLQIAIRLHLIAHFDISLIFHFPNSTEQVPAQIRI